MVMRHTSYIIVQKTVIVKIIIVHKYYDQVFELSLNYMITYKLKSNTLLNQMPITSFDII
jgi:hypothetical protein